MTKEQFLWLKQAYALNQLSLQELFEIACEDAYLIRAASQVHPIAQCRFRAKQLAFPLAAMLLDLSQLVKSLDLINSTEA